MKPSIRLRATAAAALVLAATFAARAAEVAEAPAQQWSFGGLFGTFDRGSLQRGLQVYRQVCASCHSLDLVAFRNLTALGHSPEEVQQIAAEYEVSDGPDEQGEMFQRPAKASDTFPRPFANPQAARAANNGALPPDLSLIVKGRAGESAFRGTKFREYGADYVYALLTGYQEEAPAGVEMMGGMYYNQHFPGHQIAMAPPLSDGSVDYADGTEATLQQHARDVATFLAWTSEPAMESRKRLGIKVLLFVIVMTAMLYALKKQIWSDVH
jgi:ubiquinol-cytochrome c reductase cytochrome c1 subunit